MSRTAKEPRTPSVKPVESIELEQTHVRWRMWAVIILVAIAAAAFSYAAVQLFSSNEGWQTVEPGVSIPGAADGLTLQYDIAGAAELRALAALYGQACDTIYRLTDPGTCYDGVYNLAYLSAHPNETVTVDDALYDLFAQLERAGDRRIFLAPLYVEYGNLFSSGTDTAAAAFDPRRSPAVAEFFAAVCAFVEGGDISLTLHGQGRVTLAVSEAYLAFAEQQGIRALLDLSVLRDAFTVDYVAGELRAAGYTKGYLSTETGLSCALGADMSYSVNIYDRVGDVVYPAGVLTLSGRVATVSLHSYRVHSADRERVYTYGDGTTVTAYISQQDGLSYAASSDLLVYSQAAGCAELLLAILPVYTAPTLSVHELAALWGAYEIGSVWCYDRTVSATDPSAQVTDLFHEGSIAYSFVPSVRVGD